MSEALKLVVFDWDGTLMDSQGRIVACLRAAIQDLGLAPRDDEALSNIIGLGLREAIDGLYPGSDARLHKTFIDRYRHHYLGTNATPTPLFPGVDALLDDLEARGLLLAVATGKGRIGLDLVLAQSGLSGRFAYTRCADETRSKPHPQMLEDIMAFTGVSPVSAIMIGDTEYDMLMARNAATPALAVSYGVHARERLLACEPLGCVDSIAELAQWLFAHYQSASATG